jgi:hypothetical protein
VRHCGLTLPQVYRMNIPQSRVLSAFVLGSAACCLALTASDCSARIGRFRRLCTPQTRARAERSARSRRDAAAGRSRPSPPPAGGRCAWRVARGACGVGRTARTPTAAPAPQRGRAAALRQPRICVMHMRDASRARGTRLPGDGRQRRRHRRRRPSASVSPWRCAGGEGQRQQCRAASSPSRLSLARARHDAALRALRRALAPRTSRLVSPRPRLRAARIAQCTPRPHAAVTASLLHARDASASADNAMRHMFWTEPQKIH